MHETIVIVNSQASRAALGTDDIKKACSDNKITCTVVTGSKIAATIKKSASTKKYKRIVIAGGDGSVASAVEILLKQKLLKSIELAIIPIGTGNQYAKTLGVNHKDSAHAIDVAIHSQKIQKRYVARANNKVFLLGMTVGVSARAFKQTTNKMKRTFGVIAYGISTIKALANRLPHFTVIVAGNRYVFKQAELLVMNQTLELPISIVKPVSSKDKMLVATIFGSGNGGALSTVIAALLYFFSATKITKNIQTITTKSMKVSSNNNVEYSLDGDVVGHLPVEIRMYGTPIQFVSN